MGRQGLRRDGRMDGIKEINYKFDKGPGLSG